MDFLDPKKKRAHTIRLYLGYFLVGVSILMAAYILLNASSGYWVDRRGRVYQNGLVFVASKPDGAQVNIKSKVNDFKRTVTASDRLVLPEDTYSFEFLKKGYRAWKRTVELKGGSIQRLIYPFLFPDKLVQKEISTYATKPGLVTSSPDRRWIVVQQPKSVNKFDIYDTRQQIPVPRTITVASSIFAGVATKSTRLSLVEWSSNNRHFIVKAGASFILIDRQAPQNSLNLNKYFDASPRSVFLRNKSPEQFYFLSKTGRVTSVSIDNKTPVRVAQNIAAMKPHGKNTLVVISTASVKQTKKVNVVLIDDGQSYKLRQLPKDKKYLLDIAEFNDRIFVVAGTKTDGKVYVYRDPETVLKRKNSDTTLAIRTMRLQGPEFVSFSANARFVAVQSGRSFNIYDSEQDRQYHYKINQSIGTSQQAYWMDGHRLLSNSKGKLLAFDFDGTNLQTLSGVLPGTQAMFDGDYKFVYSLDSTKRTPKRYAITQTSLEVNN